MKAKVGPVAIIIAVAVLAAFCYFMYKKTDTSSSSMGAYNPEKYGPPDYVKNMKQGNTSYMGPRGQAGGGQTGAAPGTGGASSGSTGP
ncbi:MAG TPA: hypothetical protein VFB38_18330 [Chthonomonadaceae bacterium]|nr:hypothetical protein [Chthonomonadaceae bacterium]